VIALREHVPEKQEITGLVKLAVGLVLLIDDSTVLRRNTNLDVCQFNLLVPHFIAVAVQESSQHFLKSKWNCSRNLVNIGLVGLEYSELAYVFNKTAVRLFLKLFELVVRQ
jgi:hypothetical protein